MRQTPETDSQAIAPPSIAWRRLLPGDAEGCHQYMEVMIRMSRHYADGDQAEVRRLMTSEGRCYFIGDGNNCRVVFGLRWYGDHDRYSIQSLGFIGAIEPYQALDAVVDKCHLVFASLNIDTCFTIIPENMDDPRILQLYGLLPHHPDLVVRGGHHVIGGTYWSCRLKNPMKRL